jgi:hypothetical protein
LLLVAKLIAVLNDAAANFRPHDPHQLVSEHPLQPGFGRCTGLIINQRPGTFLGTGSNQGSTFSWCDLPLPFSPTITFRPEENPRSARLNTVRL